MGGSGLDLLFGVFYEFGTWDMRYELNNYFEIAHLQIIMNAAG